MNSKYALCAAALATTMAVAPGMASATLSGQTIHTYYEYPTYGSVYIDEGASTPTFSNNLFGLVGYTVTDTQITLTALSSFSWVPAAFNGLVFQDISGPTGVTGITLDPSSNATGATASDASFTANEIDLDFGNNQAWSAGQIAVFDLGFGVGVPEPATWALFLAGFGGVGAAMRSSRKTAAVNI
jgi:hypothetical protein